MGDQALDDFEGGVLVEGETHVILSELDHSQTARQVRLILAQMRCDLHMVSEVLTGKPNGLKRHKVVSRISEAWHHLEGGEAAVGGREKRCYVPRVGRRLDGPVV